ncbi:hypothetical protein [Methylocystis echinoides]|uniref:hypothetical protein n=1 Tax=Methylocystis echinoides TaxID=29468 RepID=UPI0034419B00
MILLLADTFQNHPLFDFAFPRVASRRAILRRLFRPIVEDALIFGRVDVAVADDIVGVLLWYPPGAYPMTTRRALRGLPDYLRIACRDPLGLFKLYRIQAALDRLRPKQPHCHGYFLGGRAGARIGAILARKLLEEVDANGWPAYLETQDSRTVALYLKLGFDLIKSAFPTLPGAPLTSTMWRSAR